jgi:anti-sigma B factor antagonist
MTFELQQRDVEGIAILDVHGHLVLGDPVAKLRECVRAATAKDVILNLKHCPYIDSSGLGALIGCQALKVEAGGDVRLLKLSKRSAQLMILTKLTTVFQIFDDEEAAVNSFFVGRDVKQFDILEFVQSQEDEPPVI